MLHQFQLKPIPVVLLNPQHRKNVKDHQVSLTIVKYLKKIYVVYSDTESSIFQNTGATQHGYLQLICLRDTDKYK